MTIAATITLDVALSEIALTFRDGAGTVIRSLVYSRAVTDASTLAAGDITFTLVEWKILQRAARNAHAHVVP